MVVYLDLIFLTNIFFDASILMMTAKVRDIRIRIWRTCVAVLLGASYVLLMFNPAFSILYTAFAKLLFSLLVVLTAFGFGGLRHFLRNTGAFYLIHFASAGGMFAVHFLLLSSGDVMSSLLLRPSGSIAFAVESGLWLSFPVFIASLWFFHSVFITKTRMDAVRSYMAQVRVDIGDVSVTCSGLIDTGNRLYDPLSRVPVLVMESKQWHDVLPATWLKRIQNREADLIFTDLDDETFEWKDRLRLVPYRGVNGNSQFMLALKPDKVVVTSDGGVFEASKVLVALDGGTLTDGDVYQAIIHPMLVQEIV